MYIKEFMKEFESGKRAVHFSNREERSDFLRYIDSLGLPIYSSTRRYIDSPDTDGPDWWEYIAFEPSTEGRVAVGIGKRHSMAGSAIQYEDLEFEYDGYTPPTDEEFSAALDLLLS